MVKKNNQFQSSIINTKIGPLFRFLIPRPGFGCKLWCSIVRATGLAGGRGGCWWGIQLRITINFHNSWLSHVTRWNFDEKCNFFFTLQLRNLLFFYFALDFVFYSCPEQRFTTLHSNWDLLVQLGFNQSHHDDVVRHDGKSENPVEASCDVLPPWVKLG